MIIYSAHNNELTMYCVCMIQSTAEYEIAIPCLLELSSHVFCVVLHDQLSQLCAWLCVFCAA